MNTGIVYIILSIYGGYVGATTRPEQREQEHFVALVNQRHYNEQLQKVADEHGVNELTFLPIQICDASQLFEIEKTLINKLKSQGIPIFNSAKNVGKNPGGYNLSEETRQKQSNAKKGQNHPDNRKDYAFVSPTGDIVRVHGLKELCEENNLSMGEMSRVGSEKKSQHKGWTLFKPVH